MTEPSATADRAALLARLAELERLAAPLEPARQERGRLLEAVTACAERFLGQIDTLKTFDESSGTGEGLLGVPVGETERGIADVVALFEREVLRPGLNPASGGHLAYVPGGGIYHAALGDYLAAVSNKYAGIFFTGPGPVRMENMLVRWAADLLGYPRGAGGNLASGGSVASLVAIATARDACGVEGAEVGRAVVYLTSQVHHCIEKALRIAGLGRAVVRHVATDEGFRMRPDALEAAVAADRAAGLRPWLVIASAGTTDTGAVDPLEAIADVAKRAGCWYHVDAAYGGFFLLTAHGRAMLRGIERSDSVVLDPHKGLFLPYGCGMVLVRDAAPMLATHHYFANYMQDADGGRDETSPADVSPELTKHFRALRMWLPLTLLGLAPFRAALEEKLLLARHFRREVASLGFEVGPPPDLSIVTYRWAPAGAGVEETNRINRRIVDRVRQDGRVFISSTLIDGRFTLRLVVLSFRTHRRTIDLALEVLREASRGG